MEKRTILWLIGAIGIIVAAVVLFKFVKIWGSKEYTCQTGCITNWAETNIPKSTF